MPDTTMEDTGDILLRTILVVDDDRMFRRTIELQLAHLGCRILQAANAQEATGLMEQELPDLILLDVVMPGMDGFDFCKGIKGDLSTHHIPVIHLTALGKDAKERSFASGADDFLDKPINFVELRARIRTHLLIQGLLKERRKDGVTPAPPLEWEDGRPSRILVAQGHPQLLEHMVAELKQAGHEVRGVDSLKACMGAITGGLPDLLIVDQEMPDGRGTAFAAQLHAHPRAADLPLLLVCSQKLLKEQGARLETGASDFLAKPFQPAELRIRVDVLLKHSMLLHGGGPHRTEAALRAMKDAPSGTWSRPFFEAHLELLCTFAAAHNLPVGLVGLKLQGDGDGWGAQKDELRQAATLLQSKLHKGEPLARMSDRTFVMALPGLGQLQVESRLEYFRQAGLSGHFVGLAGMGESSHALLDRLARALKEVGRQTVS